MAITEPELELVVHNDWAGDESVGGFHVIPLSVGKHELAYPDEQWEAIRDLYVDGHVADTRALIVKWFDEQRKVASD